jgi:DNA-binding transcriptional ArsR family regulator
MPMFKSEFTVGDLIQAGALLIAAVGLLLTAIQTWRGNRQSRIQHVIDLHGRFLGDAGLVDAYYQIEYQRFRYSPEFHGSDLEKEIDRLLQSFENIAMLFELRVVKEKDLDPVVYHYIL